MACSPQQEPLLRVGTNQWPGYETLYLARQLAFFDDQNIKLKELTSATEVINAFKHHHIDVAALTLDEVLLLAQTEKDLSVFLVLDISNGADKVIAKPELRKLSDLKGKTVMLESSALGAYMMYHLLKAADLEIDDVEIDSTTVDQHYKRMLEGKADAVITFEPTASILLNKGFHALFDSRQIPNKIVDVLVTRRSVINEQYDNLSALVSAQWRALGYMHSQPVQAHRRIAPRLEMEVDDLEVSYRSLLLPDQLQNKQLLNKDGLSGVLMTAKELEHVLFEAELITTHLDVEYLFTDQFVR